MCKYIISAIAILALWIFSSNYVQSEEPEVLPQMVPDEFMEPGFHPLVDDADFPREMRDAISAYRQMIDNTDVAARFEQRTFTGSRVFGNTDTLDYEIMYPPEGAIEPDDGFPLLFTTYSRRRIADALATDYYRERYPAYVVAFNHTSRPGPLHAPPVYSDYAFLFLELFDYLFDEYNIDTNRIYGAGHSRGGSALTILSHAYASIHGTSEPLITAIVPSAGGFQNLEDNLVESIVDVKIFSLQSASDSVSNPHGSKDAFDALEKAGALDNIFWWVADSGHSPHRLGWNVADVVEWLFAQNKADLHIRPEAVLAIDHTDAGVPFTFIADASASTAKNGDDILGYTWQIFRSQKNIADYSNRYLHGYEVETGFQGAPVIGTDASVEYSISHPGTYWLRVIVVDADGNRRAVTQEIHARGIEPEPAFSFSRNHEVAGRAIDFDASASSPEYEATISSYQWDFGDGNSASGEQVSHAYASAGEYQVTLTVVSSEGVTSSLASTVTVTESFPGYRYFRFTGLDNERIWQGPQLYELAFLIGTNEFPSEPMTSNSSLGITLAASWNERNAYRVFDKDPDSPWGHHPYYFPGVLDIDVGEDQRFVPTGLRGQFFNSNSRWAHFIIEASVDKHHWDHLWTHKESVDGEVNRDGVEITFSEVPSLEIYNVEEGVYGLGREFALRANVFNINNVSEVRYYANGIKIGSSAQGSDYGVNWTPTELGSYDLTAAVSYGTGQRQATWFPISITIEPAPIISDIMITPHLMRVYPGATTKFSASSYDQYGNLLEPQPQLSWSVDVDGGEISDAGEYTAGSVYGTFTISASATYNDTSLQSSVVIRVADADDHSVEFFAGDSIRDIWEFIRKEPWEGSRADVEQGAVTIQSRGQRMWREDNFFSGIRRQDIVGDFDISVKVVSQNYTRDGSKAGIIIANDLDDLKQGGYVTLHTRGNQRVVFQREGNTLGQLGSSASTDSNEDEVWWPVWLRLVKSGTEFAAYYKFSESAEWIHLAADTIATTAENVQVALFSSSNDTSSTIYGVFTDFIVADAEGGEKPVPEHE